MMDNQLLVELAKTVLQQAMGSGYWETFSASKYEAPEPGEFLEGLKLGDTVWWVNEDNHCEVCQATIVCVKDGAGYFVIDCSDSVTRQAPRLDMAGQGYYRTREEALAAGRADIEWELEESLEAAATVERLKALLAEIDG